MVGVPIYTTVTAVQFSRFKAQKKYKYKRHKYSAFFAEFKPNLASSMYYTVFYLRRAVLVFALVIFKNRPDVQAFIFVHSSLLWAVYLAQV
jgi:hypothetical protein